MVCISKFLLLKFFSIGNGDVYNWGLGSRGVFADESNKHLKSPVINDALHHLKEDGKVLKKIKAAGDSVLALFGMFLVVLFCLKSVKRMVAFTDGVITD